jgi:acyl-CoA thioesterase-1
MALLPLGACRRADTTTQAVPAPGLDSTPAAPRSASGGGTVEIVFLGDSLTAGQGLTMDQAYPKLVERMFQAEGYGEIEVLNAGVSGDTTAGGLRRVEQLMSSDARILVIALGGNDALRGLTTAQTRENIAAIVEYGLGKGLAVMVAGMEAPTNLGQDYQASFREAFAQLGRDYRGRITFVPFLLEGVAGNPALNQTDGIHPNEAGSKIIAEHLYPRLRDMVDQLARPSMQ